MYFLFDIGGTNMRLAISSDHGKVSKSVSFPTPQKFEDGISMLIGKMKELANGEEITGAAGGIAGILDSGKSWLFYSPHLPDWEKKPLKDTLEKSIGLHVILENDAALAGLGEAVSGAGRGNQIVAYLTIGTGVGGARVVNGKVDERAMGFEPGHHIIDITENEECIELETLISGSGIQKRTGQKPDEINDQEFWNRTSRYLAIGITNTILYWSPNLVVVGGGMIIENVISLDLVDVHLNNIFKAFPSTPRIIKAELGDQSAFFGAMHILKQLSLG